MGVDWDHPLEGDIRASWVEMFEMGVLAVGISFRRGLSLVQGSAQGCVCYAG